MAGNSAASKAESWAEQKDALMAECLVADSAPQLAGKTAYARAAHSAESWADNSADSSAADWVADSAAYLVTR